MGTSEPIRSKQQVRELARYYLRQGKLRNHVLIVMGIHTALRISDLLRLRWDDVYDFTTKGIRGNISIVEKKTGKVKSIALNKSVVKALKLYAHHAAKKGGYIFENSKTEKAISRIQAYRIIRESAEALRFENRVSCHSLRKTFGYHAWKSGISPAVIMEIYNHSSYAVTRRYLGVNQDDQNKAYLELDMTDI